MSERHREDETVTPIVSPGGFGGEVLTPRDDAHLKESQGERAIADEVSEDTFAGDDGLLNPGSSPEFEHLRKPPTH